MTRTEDRLTEYLNAVADSVRADSTRPLAPPVAPAAERARMGRRAVGQRRWPGWVVPLAAAAVVVVVAAFGAVLAGHIGGHRTAPGSVQPTEPNAVAPEPRYYIEAESLPVEAKELSASLVIRSVATGAVIDRVPNPGGGYEAAMVAAPDGRTFYVAYGPRKPSANQNQYTIYSVTVLSSGKVTAPVPVKGGVVTYSNVAPTALAVSPDGGRLAMALSIYPPSGPRVIDEILVIHLRTGARQVWQGGLGQAGYVVALGSVAWAGNGQSLEFLATSCPDGAVCTADLGDPARGSLQVRSLPLSTGAGSLGASTVLLREPYFDASMAAAPAGDIDLLALSGYVGGGGLSRSLTVDQFSADGTLDRVLYRRAYPELSEQGFSAASLSTDPSGSHLLLALTAYSCPGTFSCTGTSTVGWLADGTLHPLPSYADFTSQAAW
jgi:hypothetical protein